MVAAKKAVARPMSATISRAIGALRNSGAVRATMYTPAVTMVAAWISAETGVGPSIASGSHTYSGICADFPAAPSRNSRPTNVKVPTVCSTGHPLNFANSAPKSSVLKLIASRKIASENPKSPMRFTMNALFPAFVALFFRNQKPISR